MRLGARGFAYCIGVLAFSAAIGAFGQAPPQIVVIASGSPGGSYDQIGKELARYWDQQTVNVAFAVKTTAGSRENLERLASGQADAALVQWDELEAFRKERAAAETKGEAICALGRLYVGAAQFLLRADRVRTGTLEDLNGASFYPGAKDSGTEKATLAMLEAVGVAPRLVPVAERTLNYTDAARALIEGKYDGVVLSGGPPVAAATAAMNARPGAFVLLSMTPEQSRRAIERVPGLTPSTIPPGVYTGQSAPVASVGKLTLLVVREGFDGELRGRIVAAMERWAAAPSEAKGAAGRHPLLAALTREFWKLPEGIEGCEGK